MTRYDDGGRELPRHMQPPPPAATTTAAVREIAGYAVEVNRMLACLGVALGFLALVLAIIALALI